MAKQRSQSKGTVQSLSKIKKRSNYLAQMRGEALQSILTGPISDYELEDLDEEEVIEEVALPEENDEEIITETFEEDFNPNEGYDPFDFNPQFHTSKISQENNMIFLKRNGDRMQLYLNGNLRRAIVSYQRQYEMNHSIDMQERQRLHHLFMKPLFTLRMKNFLQEILDGFFSFELDDFDFLSLLPISTSLEIESFTGVSKETVRKYLKNLSLQLENGLLISFNLITPEGLLSKKHYHHFRRVIGQEDHKQAFEEMVKNGTKYTQSVFLKSLLLFDLLEKWGLSHKDVEKLTAMKEFKLLVKYLRNK